MSEDVIINLVWFISGFLLGLALYPLIIIRDVKD